jgi:hypothetical protein
VRSLRSEALLLPSKGDGVSGKKVQGRIHISSGGPSKVSGSSQHNASPQQKVLKSKYRNLPYETQHCRLASFVSPSLAQHERSKRSLRLDLKGQLKQTGCQFFHIVSRISIGRPHIPESSDWFPVLSGAQPAIHVPATWFSRPKYPSHTGPFRRPASSSRKHSGKKGARPNPVRDSTVGSGSIAGTESSPQD